MADRSFDAFVDRFHAHKTRNPNARVNLGVVRDLDRLPDPSLEDAEDRVAEAQCLLSEVEPLRAAERDFDRRLDLDLAALDLEAEIHTDSHRFAGQRRLEQMPTAADDIGDGLFMLFINDPRPARERLSDIVGRLREVPDYLASLRGRLGAPLERWREIDAEQVGELPGLFDTLSRWSQEQGFEDHGAFLSAREGAEASLEEYAEFLRGLETHRGLHLDAASARSIVALRGIEKPLEELHEIARDFLAHNAAELEDLRGRLASKYDLAPDSSIESVEMQMRERFAPAPSQRNPDAILARYQNERERVLEFIGEHDLFPIPEDQDMKILRTPGFMTPSIPAGAMVSPAPFREGVRTSLIYLTLTDELVARHSDLDVPGMMIHEGIPGHHLQLSTAAAHPSVIRRHTSAMDQAEGWTTMLEDYMLDVGYMGDLTDEARFTAKRDTNRIGARVAIDLFFMTGDRGYLDVGVAFDREAQDPFEAAGSLLRAVTGFSPGRVEAELNWYSRERGYPLCYLTGNRLVWELKRDVQTAQKGRLSGLDLDRTFHDVYLNAGNMPVSFLRQVFEQRGLL
ncbi:MAG: DUF885 domain-containing protein [bacterium]|nr:DUF885 domain-containing protein [bacterium]